ncbi:MAG: carboxyl transferase domain-containing protein [Novosphingobium sp.]
MIRKLLIANRAEIAVRIARTADSLGIETVAIHAEDDDASPHMSACDIAHALPGSGPAAYLDIEQVVAAARAHGCDAIHPGYGFLSENGAFARSCSDAGLVFVGPRAELIDLFGDKVQSRALAAKCGVPMPEGTPGPASLDDLEALLNAQGADGAIMIKAVAGGGGRGIRLVERAEDLQPALERCRSEAMRAFGDDTVYGERFIRRARHIEVQIAGDGVQVRHLLERECTLQRSNQKLVEFAPAPGLSAALRDRLTEAACRMARECGYDSIGTFEFLVDLDRQSAQDEFVFIEANPRLQVEHTVSEEVLGIDLVAIQLALAAGASLADLPLREDHIERPRGLAMQLRINMETMDRQGRPQPATGKIDTFTAPGGPGIRLDSHARAGYWPAAGYDSLLAKLIVSVPTNDYGALLARARRALGEFEISGVATNISFLGNLLDHPAIAANEVTTGFIADHIGELLASGPDDYTGQSDASEHLTSSGQVACFAPMAGVVIDIMVGIGDAVTKGSECAILEAMKMEHVVVAQCTGIVRAIAVGKGSHIGEGSLILSIEPADMGAELERAEQTIDPDHIRADLAALETLVARTLDESRPDAVRKRSERGQRTARANVLDLCDDGSFGEYGQLTVAFQHSRRSMDELRELSPADGMVAGIGTVNAAQFGKQAGSVAVVAYDGSVLAGTQGHMNHKKATRLFNLARERSLPLVLFAEGGGGRPREDPVTIVGMNIPSFRSLAELSGKVPIVGIVAGRCFAGNAALVGLADVIIATEDSSIGMAGPAMIEAAGLGACTPEEVGPIDVQCRNGVVDIRAIDEADAVRIAKLYLSYFQGQSADWECADQRLLRHAIPENRMRAYDVRAVAQLIADSGSWLELRQEFGGSYVTGLMRVEGRPMGLIANNPLVDAGAIGSDAADKAARFMRLCDAHGLPILSLIDTPGIMVGSEAERTGLVRHSARLFATAASIEVPIFAVVLRKAYGLGAMAAAGGHFQIPFSTVAWPTGELGGMGLEGAVRLAYRNELAAIADPVERQAFFEERVASRYEKGKATHAAAYFELDAVIDPAETRSWIVRGFSAVELKRDATPGKSIDTW